MLVASAWKRASLGMPLHMPRDIVPTPLILAVRALGPLGAGVALLRVGGVLGPQVAVEGALIEVAFFAERAAEWLPVLSALVFP